MRVTSPVFATQAPLIGEAGADPEGEESDAHMVDEAFGLLMEDGASLEVALEFTKCFFDFDKVFVVALDLRGICPCDREIGVGDIPRRRGRSRRRRAWRGQPRLWRCGVHGVPRRGFCAIDLCR